MKVSVTPSALATSVLSAISSARHSACARSTAAGLALDRDLERLLDGLHRRDRPVEPFLDPAGGRRRDLREIVVEPGAVAAREGGVAPGEQSEDAAL